MGADMDSSQLLLEYLKEQYTQARQHETRQTAATTVLTAASGAIVSLTIKDGHLLPEYWWLGIVVALLGIANIGILEAHQIGNRFHTKLAGKVRVRLESECDWDALDMRGRVDKPTATKLRAKTLEDMGLGPKAVISAIVYKRLLVIPIVMIFLGYILSIICLFQKASGL